MADFRDVVAARAESDSAAKSIDAYGGAIEDGREGDVALAVCLAARVIALEIRALGTLLDFARGDAR